MKMPNVSHLLLSAILAMGAFSLKILDDRAQEVVNGLHEVTKAQAEDHSQIRYDTGRIDHLVDSDSRQWTELGSLKNDLYRNTSRR